MLLLIALSQTVYRWTDERGVMHYGDEAPREDRAERARVPRSERRRAIRMTLLIEASLQVTADERNEAESKADRALRRGELSTALTLYQTIASTFPKDPQVQVKLARIRENL